MNILVENSGYHLLNMGDLAMLQVAIERLNKVFPSASITVFTNYPDRLSKHCPGTLAIMPEGRNTWVSRPLIGKLHKNRVTRKLWPKIEEKARYNFPTSYNKFLKFKMAKFPTSLRESEKFFEVFQLSDLVIATGGGYITDAFMNETNTKLDMLSLAAKVGKPTAMLGQGMGPLKDKVNQKKAASILPLINVISLRESKASLPLLKSIGISHDRVTVTGDDAIELAYNARPEEIGQHVGINLRVAKYSDVTEDSIQTLKNVFQEFAIGKNIQLLPVPIDRASFDQYIDSDVTSIQKLLQGFDDESDGGSSLDTPIKVIRQVGKCRVVVTGSYHGAVFALSQGIPVIGLAKSQYYIDKFAGLAGQFPGGCRTLILSSDSLEKDLRSNLEYFWSNAEQLRDQFLKAAKHQIELSWSVYQKLSQLNKVS